MSRVKRFLLTGSMLAVAIGTTRAANTDYLYCKLPDTTNNVVYFTNVILGDMANSAKYAAAFQDYLKIAFPEATGTAACTSAKAFKDTLAKEDAERQGRILTAGHPAFKDLLATSGLMNTVQKEDAARASDDKTVKKRVETGWTWSFDGPYGFR